MSVNDRKRTVSADFEVINKFQGVGAFANTESMRINCISLVNLFPKESILLIYC